MTAGFSVPPTVSRVEAHTPGGVQQRLRARDDARIVMLAEGSPEQLDARLAALEGEWDVERALQLNASLASLAALLAVRGRAPGWLAAPAVVFGFLLQHSVSGWCPPLPVLRRAGVRTRREIERERHALKTLRGDYDVVPARGEASAAARVRLALLAVDRT